ncbi:Uncharacterised protein [Priestia megaterium]|nr:Uncharacterised protein [Priestia megaterium]
MIIEEWIALLVLLGGCFFLVNRMTKKIEEDSKDD